MKTLTFAVMIAKEVPILKDEIFQMANKNEIAKLISLLTKHINIAANNGNKIVVQRGLEIMDKIYQKGNFTFQSAVENIFIFSCDQLLDNKKGILLTSFPQALQKAYLRQVYQSGS